MSVRLPFVGEPPPADPRVVHLRCIECGELRQVPIPDEATTPESRRLAWKIARAWSRVCAQCRTRAETQAEEDRAASVHRRRLADCAIPVQLLCRLSDLAPRSGQHRAFEAAASWARDGGYLFLQGDVGRGKSTIAAAALLDSLDLRDGMWVGAPRLLQLASADFGSEDHRRAQRILTSNRALVLDDLGHGQGVASDRVRNQFHSAINERLVGAVPLLITSNKHPTELARLYGEWLGSRLAGHFTQVRVEGEDLRLT